MRRAYQIVSALYAFMSRGADYIVKSWGARVLRKRGGSPASETAFNVGVKAIVGDIEFLEDL